MDREHTVIQIIAWPALVLLTYVLVFGGKLSTLARFWDRTLAPFLLATIEYTAYAALVALGLFVAWHVLGWLARYVATHRVVRKDEWRELHRKLTVATKEAETLDAENRTLAVQLKAASTKLEKATASAASVTEAALAQIVEESAW